MSILSQLFGGGASSQANTATAEDRLMNLYTGNLSGELSTGDKLMALSQLLRSVTRGGREAGLTPGAVIQDIQKQKAGELQNRIAVEQLRAAAEQKQKQTTIVNEYAGALEDPKQRMALMAAGPEKASEKIIEIAFRPRQVQQIMTDDSGNSRIVFGDGTSGMLDFKVERGRKWIQADPGNTGTTKLLLVDEKTGAPVLDDQGGYQTMAVGSNWAEQQRIAQGWQRINKEGRVSRGGDGGGGESEKLKTIVYYAGGKPVYSQGTTLPGGWAKLKDGQIVKIADKPY